MIEKLIVFSDDNREKINEIIDAVNLLSETPKERHYINQVGGLFGCDRCKAGSKDINEILKSPCVLEIPKEEKCTCSNYSNTACSFCMKKTLEMAFPSEDKPKVDLVFLLDEYAALYQRAQSKRDNTMESARMENITKILEEAIKK